MQLAFAAVFAAGAPVHEHRDAGTDEHDVRGTAQARERPDVFAEPHPKAVAVRREAGALFGLTTT